MQEKPVRSGRHHPLVETNLEAEALLQIVNELPTPIAVLEGPKLRYTFVNPAFRAILRCEEITGRTFRELLPDGAQTLTEEALLAVLHTGRPGSIGEWTLPESSNRSACWNAEARPLSRAPGEQKAVLLSLSDCSDSRVEAALQESETRFRVLADGLPLMVWVNDGAGAQDFVNRAYCEFFGVTVEEMRGDHWQSLIHPADADQYREAFLACARERKVFHAEVRARRADGQWRWIESWGRPRFSRRGEFLGFVGASTDIEDRKEAQQSLERTTAQSRAMLQQMTEGLVIFDPQGNLLEMNPAALAMHGFDSIEHLQRHLSTLDDTFHIYDLEGNLLPTDEWPIGRVLRGECFRSLEVRVVRPDTGKSWIGSYGGAPVYGSQGELLLAIVTLRDVTAQREAEAGLKQAKARLETALTANEFGIWDWDVRTDRLLGDRNLLNLFGFDDAEQELPLEAYSDRIHGEDRGRVQQAIEQALASGGVYSEEYRVIHPNGAVRWIHARGRVETDSQGRAVSFPGVAVDVTERKQAEASLREADRRKDEFLATLAHELRNPLAPIQSGIDLLRLVGSDSSSGERTLEMMERQMKHMVRLVDDLLDVSRISRGKINLRKERVDLRMAIRSALDSALMSQKRKVSIDLSPDALLVDADPVRIQQIVTNLLNNAVKFTQEGGRIWIGAGREDGRAWISVRDNGTGISPNMLEAVFEPFSQADSSRGGGLGIGLTLVRSLVELHGGSVVAHSKGAGFGSEFIVRLPVLKVSDFSEPERQKRAAVPLGEHRVLIVDDNRDAAESLAMLIETRGASVRTALDGASALRLLEEFQPHTALLDIGMPDMDGYELARRMRESRKATRLVAITGWGQAEDRRRAKKAGFDHHLVKPVALADLERVLLQPHEHRM